MDLFRSDIKKIPTLLIGLFSLALGILLMKRSGLGMAAWGVFHTGLELELGISFGVVTQLVGLIILIFTVTLVKVKVGIATILNILLVGLMFDGLNHIIPLEPNSNIMIGITFTAGLLFMTFGRSLYISVNLGAGPRDGLFVGLYRATGISVKYIKPMIELTVLVIGVLLGAPIGIGTVIAAIVSGYLVQFFFNVIGFDPKDKKQSDILEYFKQKVSS